MKYVTGLDLLGLRETPLLMKRAGAETCVPPGVWLPLQ
jgi:hypothetical protein